jgi:hypothetical protein
MKGHIWPSSMEVTIWEGGQQKNYTLCPMYKIPNGLTYSKIFNSKAFKNIQELVFLGVSKYIIWQPCLAVVGGVGVDEDAEGGQVGHDPALGHGAEDEDAGPERRQDGGQLVRAAEVGFVNHLPKGEGRGCQMVCFQTENPNLGKF